METTNAKQARKRAPQELGFIVALSVFTVISAVAPGDDFASQRSAQLNDAYQRASQAWEALRTPPVRPETAQILLRETLHVLRGPSEVGYRFADIIPPERKPGQTGDLWVTLNTVRIDNLYEQEIGEYKASGKESFWIRVYLPSRRSPMRRNGEVFIDTITVFYRLGDSFKGTLTESPKKWLEAGEEYVVLLPYPADAVEVAVKMATREADLNKSVVRIETRPGVVRDHEQAEDFYLVVLADSALQALKENNIVKARAFARSLYELLSARTGQTAR